MLEMRVLDVNAVYRDFEKILRRLIGEDVEIVAELEADINRVRADRSQLQQILMNLAVNARDAMPNGGRIVISTGNEDIDDEFAALYDSIEAGPHVMMSVSDNGHGMDAETLKQVFEPFFTTKGRGKGTGLGLATVYGIVKQHKGSIWAESTPDVGTTFKVFLPRVDEVEEVLETDEPEVHEVSGGHNETVLVVEDEEVVRSFVCDVLNDSGYDVLEAESGVEAIKLVEDENTSIDLLITDVIMPKMNGRELSQRLATSRPDLKVLFMSGYTDNVIGDHGVLGEGMNFIQKPFTMQTFTQKVRSVIDGSQKGLEPTMNDD
jgi:two-component system, cell cycle sensor histidine kinase and response regulator CckA